MIISGLVLAFMALPARAPVAVRAVPSFEGDFIANCEGCVLRVYDDARPNYILKPGDKVIGTLTAGWGHTGPELKIGMEVTLQMALDWRAADIETAARIVCRKLTSKGLGYLSDHQYGAMIDFAFNLGAAGTTIWQDINAGKLDDALSQLMLFDHGMVGGKLVVIPGLDHRREAEKNLWRTPDVPEGDVEHAALAQAAIISASAAPVQAAAAAGTIAPSSGTTRTMATPPRPTGGSLIARGPFQAACAAAAGCTYKIASNAPDVVQKANDTVDFLSKLLSDHVDKAPKLASAVELLGYVGVGIGIAVPVAMAIKHWADRHQPG